VLIYIYIKRKPSENVFKFDMGDSPIFSITHILK
jgi:hypothetical protein